MEYFAVYFYELDLVFYAAKIQGLHGLGNAGNTLSFLAYDQDHL